MKSKAPLMSLNPRGSFMKTLTASSNRGVNYIQGWHKPGGRPTANQLAVREVFFQAKSAWNELTDEEKAVYNERARLLPLTGYNLFIKEYEPDAMKKIVVNVTNDDILALQSTPKEILPIPPTGKAYVIFGMFLSVNTIPGGYSNISTTPGLSSRSIGFCYGAFFTQLSEFIDTSNFGGNTQFICQFLPYAVSNFDDNMIKNYGFSNIYLAENNISLYLQNDLGNFAGGAPGTSGKVTLYYDLVDTV